jgi:hypothetical protein
VHLVTYFLARRYVYAANCVLFSGSPIVQIFVQFFCCLLMLLYLADVRPLNSPFLNRMEIFNEVTLLCCSYFLFAFTDFVAEAGTRYMLGWGFIGLIGMNVMVNLGALFYSMFVNVRALLRPHIYKWRLKKWEAGKLKRQLDIEEEKAKEIAAVAISE